MRSGLGSGASSEPIVQFALWSGLGAMALILLLIGWIVLLRVAYRRNERRRQKFLSVWRGLLTEGALALLAHRQLPAVGAGDAIFFLSYWSHLQNSLRGEARERLNSLARAVGMDRVIRRMLHAGGGAERLLAIVCLGHLGEKGDAEMLRKLLMNEQPIVCLHAARALLRIDPDAIGELLPAIAQRSDLPTVSIANILKELGADMVSPVLAGMLHRAFRQDAAPQYLARLIAFTVTAHPSVVHPSLREIMDETQDAEVLAACLRAVHTPADLPRVRRLIGHPDWRVRVQAASALGDMGEKEDMELLTGLLSDPQWWVRYRAAQAISRLPFVSTADLEGMKKRLDDRFAIDMLVQIISERMP